jgi:hypothetical protein
MNREERFVKQLFEAEARWVKAQPNDDALPLGVATSIAARWAGGSDSNGAATWLWENLALRAAIAGMAMAAALLTFSFAWAGQSQAREARAAAEIELLLSIP